MHPNKKIKLLQCIRQGHIGGGESHLLTVVQGLNRQQFEPVVLSFTHGPMVEKLEALKVPVTVIPTTTPFDVRCWPKVLRWMKKEKFDLVHAHGTRANSNVIWAARTLNIPVVYTIHGWSFHAGQSWWVRQLRVLGEKYLVRRSALNIAVSETSRQTGAAHFKQLKSVVVPNGIEVSKFAVKNDVSSLRSELDTPENAVVVLFLARLTYQKQPLLLLQAFEKAAERNQNLFLWMIGNGEEKSAAEAFAENSVVKNRMRLQGFRQDVPDLLHAADIFVLPSLWEGLPIALLEAMAAGKAVIASAADGTRELIKDGENGLLMDENDRFNSLVAALEKLAADSALRENLGAAAKQTICTNYDSAAMVANIESLYLQTLK